MTKRYEMESRRGDVPGDWIVEMLPNDDGEWVKYSDLSAPTSEEVAEILELLHEEEHSALEINSSTLIPTDILVETADLLQRLDRENQNLKAFVKHDYISMKNHHEKLDLATQQRDEALDLIGRIKGDHNSDNPWQFDAEEYYTRIRKMKESK